MLIHVQGKDKQSTSYFLKNATLLGLKPHFCFIVHHSTSQFFYFQKFCFFMLNVILKIKSFSSQEKSSSCSECLKTMQILLYQLGWKEENYCLRIKSYSVHYIRITRSNCTVFLPKLFVSNSNCVQDQNDYCTSRCLKQVCVCVYVRERERERDAHTHTYSNNTIFLSRLS